MGFKNPRKFYEKQNNTLTNYNKGIIIVEQKNMNRNNSKQNCNTSVLGILVAIRAVHYCR